jgi:hypothetical protein
MTIRYVVSDRAKALIKLAADGFECLSIPDLFHASRELSTLFGLRLHRQRQRLQDKFAKAMAQLTLLQELANSAPEIASQYDVIAHLKHEYAHIAGGIETYTPLLHQISLLVHPFALSVAVRPVPSAQITQELHDVAEGFPRNVYRC